MAILVRASHLCLATAPSRSSRLEVWSLVRVAAMVVLGGCGTCESRPGNRECVVIASAAVRSCQAAFELNIDEPARVTFPDGVRGAYFQRGRRLGLALIAREDQALRGTAAEIHLPDGGTHSGPLLIECFDAFGTPVEKPGFSLSCESE